MRRPAREGAGAGRTVAERDVQEGIEAPRLRLSWTRGATHHEPTARGAVLDDANGGLRPVGDCVTSDRAPRQDSSCLRIEITEREVALLPHIGRDHRDATGTLCLTKLFVERRTAGRRARAAVTLDRGIATARERVARHRRSGQQRAERPGQEKSSDAHAAQMVFRVSRNAGRRMAGVVDGSARSAGGRSSARCPPRVLPVVAFDPWSRYDASRPSARMERRRRRGMTGGSATGALCRKIQGGSRTRENVERPRRRYSLHP